MTCGAVAAQIQIELIIFLIQSQLFHTLLQDLQIVFTLAAANDLADTGYQAVHSSHSLAILVQLHVECLNLLRIIGYEYRSLKFLLGQVSLMLGLQIASPEYLVIELIVVLLQDLDSLSVGHMTEIRVDHMLQSFDQSLIHELIEECHLFGRIFQHIADHIF